VYRGYDDQRRLKSGSFAYQKGVTVMFTDSSVFVLAVDGKIYKLEVEREAQQAICDASSIF